MPAKNGMGRHTTPLNVPEAPVFYPTYEEFKDFNKFVEYLETTDAPRAGICKIVPPKEWIPRKIGYKIEDLNYTINGPVRQQFNQVGDKGMYQTKGILKPQMTVKEYYELANNHCYRTPIHSDYDNLERKYWKSLSFVPPIYGCDVADHLTDPEEDVWNIARLGSILDTIKEDKEIDIQGVLSPYLYFGMWKATFSWHVEDMDLYAINMVHHGAPKTWYCVPPQYGYLLEKACREIFPTVASWCSNFMRHKTCMIAPEILDKYGVPYQKVVQEERNIIITFPYAYHCGFNHGFNIAESTNFAMPRWIEYGKRSRPCDCSRSRVSFNMDIFVKKYQPEKYQDWISGKDIAPHPEDPPDKVAEVRLQIENPEKWRAMQEEKLRVKDDKRARSLKAKAEEGDNEMIDVDVYQHPERLNIKVEVNPVTMKCRGNGNSILRDFLDEPEPDVKDLIERGMLIKIESKKVKKIKRFKHEENEEDDDDMDKVDVLIYRHITEKDTEAVVDPETLDLVGGQSKQLVKFLNQSNLTMKALIEMGIFTKFIEAKVKIERDPVDAPPVSKKMKLEVPEEYTGPVQTVTLHLYKHSGTNLVLKVNPKTMQPFYRLSQQAKYFMRDRSVKELVQEGILVFDGTVDVEGKVYVSPSAKTAATSTTAEPSTSTAAASTLNEPSRRWNACDIYKTKDGKNFLNVSRKTQKILGKKSDEMRKKLEGKDIQQLVEEGELVFVGQREVKSGGVISATKTVSFTTLRIKSIEQQRIIDVANDGSRLVYHITGSTDPQKSELVTDKSVNPFSQLIDNDSTKTVDKVIDEKKEKLLSKILEKVVVKECDSHNSVYDAQCSCTVMGLTHIYPMLLGDAFESHKQASYQVTFSVLKNKGIALVNKKSSEVFIISNEAVTSDKFTSSITFKIGNEDSNDGTAMEVDEVITNQEQAEDKNADDVMEEDVRFIEEDDPEEVAKVTAVASARVKAETVYNIDSGDEEDEDMLYTTESSSDSNESSDDPNYGTSGRKEGLWNRRGNKSKKRRIKKMKKLKMLTAQEREERRKNAPEFRRMKEEKRSVKRAKAVDTRTIAGLTRQIVEYLTSKFGMADEDVAKDFSIPELKAKFNEDRSNIVSVIRIFIGLEIVSKDENEEGEETYSWHGIDLNKLYPIFLDILNGGRKEAENNIWLVFSDFVQIMLKNRKGARVHPTIIGQSNYGVNETRRVTFSAAVLEGLDLATHMTDNLGGTVWKGRHLLLDWYKSLCHRHFDDPEMLKKPMLVLNKAEVSAEQLEVAVGDCEQNQATLLETPVLNVDGLSQEQQRSVVNQKVVCRCGTTKKMDVKVEREDGKHQVRNKVYTGHKKRSRCKKCPGCVANRCGICNYCLKPHLKKPCVLRVCQFPVVPKCPCFS